MNQQNSNDQVQLKVKKTRKPFSPAEDQIINFTVSIIGTKQWPMIAKFVKGRTSKQCRDRYMNYLKPGLSVNEWTTEEDNFLLDLYKKFGPKWGVINKFFNSRNQISLKNRFRFLQKNMNPNDINCPINEIESPHSEEKTNNKIDENLNDFSSKNIFDVPVVNENNGEQKNSGDENSGNNVSMSNIDSIFNFENLFGFDEEDLLFTF